MVTIIHRSLVLLVISALSLPALSADFRVKAGEDVTISQSQTRLQVDQFILEDGATIRFAPGVKRWQVSAAHTEVGENVTIMGTGSAGADGAPGDDAKGQAPECEDGKAGKPGKPGAAGEAAVVIAMNLKISRWGSMTIDTRGGAGGTGGEGGKGQQAGEVDKCSQTRGGPGGAGGEGGDGGNGGNIRIQYSYLPGSQLNSALDNRLTLKNQGGSGGAGGKGGPGGEGTDGHYITMRTLTGSKKWVPGGKEGPEGPDGKAGRTGVDGQLLIEEDLSGLLDQSVQQQSAQVDQIRQQLKQELAKETARMAAEAAQTQQQLQAQNAVLLERLKQAGEGGAGGGAAGTDLHKQMQKLKATQADQAEKIRDLEQQVSELKSLLQKALSQ